MNRLCFVVAVVLGLGGCLTLPGPAPTPPAPASDAPPPVPGAPSYVVFGQRYYPMADSSGYKERGVASWYGGKFHGRNTANGERYDMHGMTAAHKTLPLPTWVRVTNLRNAKSVVVRVNDRGPFVKNRLIDLSYEAARRIDMLANGTTLVEVEALAAADEPVVAATSAATTAAPAATTATATMSAAPGSTTAVADDRAVIQTQPASAPPQFEPTPVGGALIEAAVADTSAVAYQPGSAIYVQVGAFGEQENARRMVATLYNAGIESVRLASTEQDSTAIHRVQIGPVAGVAEYDALIVKLDTLGISDTHLITD